MHLVGSRITHADAPHVAYDPHSFRVVAVGERARTIGGAGGLVVANGFQASRVILDDVDLAEIALRHAIREVLSRGRVRRRSFDLILHPLDVADGSLTSLERSALEQLGRGVGARRVAAWVGRELSDEEIEAGRLVPL